MDEQLSGEYVTPESAAVDLAATFPLRHQCPFVDEMDDGTVTLRWACVGATFELHTLGAYFAGWSDSSVSHEALTDRIAHDLANHDGIDLLAVETTWTTAGASITVTAQIGNTP